MANKKDAYTDKYVIRHYRCRICGKPVVISQYKLRKLNPKEKRMCPDCIYVRNLPYEPSYHPYGPYFLGGF